MNREKISFRAFVTLGLLTVVFLLLVLWGVVDDSRTAGNIAVSLGVLTIITGFWTLLEM